jgi:hypothetical protein
VIRTTTHSLPPLAKKPRTASTPLAAAAVICPKLLARSTGPRTLTGTLGMPRSLAMRKPATEMGAAAMVGDARPSTSRTFTPMLNAMIAPQASAADAPFGCWPTTIRIVSAGLTG